jgi:hypothetical protein
MATAVRFLKPRKHQKLNKIRLNPAFLVSFKVEIIVMAVILHRWFLCKKNHDDKISAVVLEFLTQRGRVVLPYSW